MNSSSSYEQQVSSFLSKITLENDFYDQLLLEDQKKISRQFRSLFFQFELMNQNEINNIKLTQENSEYLSKWNNGMNYTFIFDFVGASQEFKNFDILKRGINLTGQGSTKEEIKNFVYFPDIPEIYNKGISKMSWSDRTEVRITDDSSMAVCLNQANLYEIWQLQFQKNMIRWNQGERFSPGKPIGLGKNICQSLKKINEIWREEKVCYTVWIFQEQLKKPNKLNLFIDGSGNGALIRSAGLYELYILAYKQFLQNKNLSQHIQKFNEAVVISFMLDQYDQSSLTHSGLQAQVSILLLAYIQIKLLIRQLNSRSMETSDRILSTEIKVLVKEFQQKYLEKVLQKLTNYSYSLNEMNIWIDKVEKAKEENQEMLNNKYPNGRKNFKETIMKYLNVNTNFNGQEPDKIALCNVNLLYYQLFYTNKEGQYMWEDPYFIQYLAEKRIYSREGANLDIKNPIANEYTMKFNKTTNKNEYISEEEYIKYLQKGDSGYFGAYAPDCMSLILNLIISTDTNRNQDIFHYLKRIATCKGDCDSYGAVLGTVLAAFDLNYHSNYQDPLIKNRNNPLSHLNHMNLQKDGFLKDIVFSINKMKQFQINKVTN